MALVVTMTGAGAITGGSSLVAVSKPTLGVGQSAAPAGNLTLTPTIPANSWAAGEIVTITVGTPIASPANCTGATPAANFVAFNGTPTVSVVGTATATLSTTSTAPCGALVTPRRDQLVITFATAGTGTLTISNVRYDIGTAVANGDVVLSATDSDTNLVATGPAASNAFLTNVGFGANTPAVGLRADSTVQPISNIVLTEQVVDAAGATVCVRLNGGDTFDATAPAPTVTVSPAAGDTAVVALAPGNTALQVTVTDAVADTAMSTFTIAGLRVSAATTASPGPVTAILTSGLCSAPATPANTISADTVVAGVAGVQRFGGSDRFTTAQQLFADAFPCGGTTGLANAVVARGDDFPDALAASYLAGTLPGA
ncbi:MAG: cell wall-binding repeat-containing protein, partial [Acidimicrobiales bacterium]